MKTTVKILASLSILAAALSCQQFEVDTQMTPEKMAANARLESNVFTAYTVNASNPQPVSFNITSNVPWSIIRNDNAEWCTISPASSAVAGLNADVTIEVLENEALEDRSASFTIRSDSYQTKSYTFTITQGRRGKFYVTPITKTYSAMGGPLSFTISTNYAWEVRSDVDWLSFSQESGEGSASPIQIVATAERSDVMTRTATIYVVANDTEESFEVTQQGKFEVVAPSGSFSDAGGTMDFKVKTDLEWEVNADQMWVSFSEEEGEGDGTAKVITITAEPNAGIEREALITVTAGGEDKSFLVSQDGVTFEIVEPASAIIGGNVGEMILEVNTHLSWEPYTEEEWMTVEKVDDSHFKVVAAWNPYFKPRTGLVGIKSGSNTVEMELMQEINFTFEGNCEVLEDGSVKLSGGAASRIVSKDTFRYIDVVFTMGDVHFVDKSQIWFDGVMGNANLYNWLTVGKTRVRLEGTLADGKGARIDKDSYLSVDYSISQDELNAMTTYGIKMYVDPEDETLFYMDFDYNGANKCHAHARNPFYYDQENGASFWLGCYDGSAPADSWYVVKSCVVNFPAK